MINWVENTEKYGTGELGKLGKVLVFRLYWDSCRSADDDKCWALQSLLPAQAKAKVAESREELKIIADKMLESWLKATGLK